MKKKFYLRMCKAYVTNSSNPKKWTAIAMAAEWATFLLCFIEKKSDDKKKRRGRNKKIHERILCQCKDLSFFPFLPPPSHCFIPLLFQIFIPAFHSCCPFCSATKLNFVGFYVMWSDFSFFWVFQQQQKVWIEFPCDCFWGSKLFLWFMSSYYQNWWVFSFWGIWIFKILWHSWGKMEDYK